MTPTLGEYAQFITALAVAYNVWQTRKNGKRAEGIKADVVEIKLQTDGINAQLVKTTGEKRFNEGVTQGEDNPRDHGTR